jgi:membrane protein
MGDSGIPVGESWRCYYTSPISVSCRHTAIRKIANFLLFVVRRLWHGRLSQVAASLSYTTLLALVPLLAIGFGIAAAFPQFGDLDAKLRRFIGGNLLPGMQGSHIILDYVKQFSDHASQLTLFGILALGVTSLLLLDTITGAFDQMWEGVAGTRPRPFAQTLLMYAAILVLGPVALGLSLTATSYIASISVGLAEGIPLVGQFVLKLSSEIITVFAFSVLYYSMAKVRVRPLYALIGGFAAGVLFEIMGRLFAAYVTKFPTYTLVYGTFSVLPIFLLWIYFSWLVVLFGALVTASLHAIWRAKN